MNNEMMSGIYAVTCGSAIYIGECATSFRTRWGKHTSDFKHGINNEIIQEAYDQFGMESVKYHIIEICDEKVSTQDREKIEKYWVDQYKQDKRFLVANKNPGGKGKGMGYKHANSCSEYHGVSQQRGIFHSYWMAFIYLFGKTITITTCKNEEDAAVAYDRYVIENNLDRPLNFIWN